MADINLIVVHTKKQIFPPSLSQWPFLYYLSKYLCATIPIKKLSAIQV